MMAELVRHQDARLAMNPTRMRAKNDVLRMIEILKMSSSVDMVSRTRIAVLSEYV